MAMTKTNDLLGRFPVNVFGAHVMAASAIPPTAKTMDERLARLELELESHNFVSKYSYYFDAKDLNGVMSLFAPTCELVNSAGTYVGTDALRGLHEGDFTRTEVSFHHFNNLMVTIEDLASRTVYVTTYMYNLAIREEEPYGTVGSIIFCLKGQPDGALRATAIRIAIDSRHTLKPKLVPAGDPGPFAKSARNAFDLVGRRPRFPAKG